MRCLAWKRGGRDFSEKIMKKKKWLCVVPVILAAVVGCAACFVWKSAERTAAVGTDGENQVKRLCYSKYYNDDGTLNCLNGKASDITELCEYENLQLQYSDLNLEEDADEEVISRKLGRYLKDYLVDSCELDGLSDAFAGHQMEIMRYELEQDYEFEKAVQEMSHGTFYDTIYDYYGVERDAYEDYVSEQGIREAVLAVIVQAIAEQQGIQVTREDADQYLDEQQMEESFDELAEKYGKGYLYHITMQDKVFAFIESELTLKKDGE